MTKRLLPTRMPGTRVVHYVDPTRQHAQLTDLMYLTPADLAEARLRQAQRVVEQRRQYDRWRLRRVEIAEHDRKMRRFWLGFGAVFGTALLAGIALVGWLLWSTLAGLGLLALPLLGLATAAVVVGGHRCITVVQHWH